MTIVAAKLDSVSWDFTDAFTREGAHAIHPYPAKFIPQIPRTLIELFHPGDGQPVLDPFCGSGTTLVESMLAGIDAVGIDLHPLATLIAKVKTTPLTVDLLKVGKEVCSAAKDTVMGGAAAVPDIPNLNHWFQKHVQEALAALITEIRALPDADVSDALKVAFSSIVVRVSNQESDTRYAAVKKNVSRADVWSLFERAVGNVDAAVSSSRLQFHKPPKIRVVNKDLMDVEPHEVGQGIGLVVTSPPYPNAYEYWLYHKYRMYWLGMDPIAVREREIGARPHYFKKNHQTEHDFEEQMRKCFSLLSKVMLRGAYACFVVGRSVIHGRHIDNEALLGRAAEPHGFVKAGQAARTIASNRKSFNPAHSKINREGIVVFRLEG
jgi:site-specific DNA-methyltransferase (cytosine-N4-specific)